MAAGGERYLIKAVQQSLAIEDMLAGTDLLAWRSLSEVAQGAQVSKDQAFRILQTLKAAGRVEQSDKGWRIDPHGIIRHAFKVQEYFKQEISRFTGKSS
jgi:DNA-binding IclR family transcriptional regulator